MSATFRPASVFRFSEFTFDCDSRQLLRGAVELHLSPKAQHLLHQLLLARPRALSRQELYDALWPSTFVSESNLANIVNEVRHVLGDDPRASQFIRTVHGYGYSFCGEVAVPGEGPHLDAMLLCNERTYQLFEGPNAVGRAPDCRIVIHDAAVSRHHAVILVDSSGAVSIQDLDSKNGTHVNGRRIGHSPVKVTHGEKITFGAVVASIMSPKISSAATLRLTKQQFRRVMEQPTPALLRINQWIRRNPARANREEHRRRSIARIQKAVRNERKLDPLQTTF